MGAVPPSPRRTVAKKISTVLTPQQEYSELYDMLEEMERMLHDWLNEPLTEQMLTKQVSSNLSAPAKSNLK